ncbi:MAG TPA: hypothetical protein VF550_19045 [Polyangia bacterium]
MRKFLVAVTLSTLFLIPAVARAGFLVEASLGQGYQASPTPREWERLNLEIAPGYAPSLPVLSMFRLQLGIVTDFGNKAGTKTDMELRPMISVVPPIFPLYGRVIFVVNNLLERGGTKRDVQYGAAVGARIGLPSIGIIPSMGVFAEIGALPGKRDFFDTTTLTTSSKTAWVLEGRVGAYLDF